MGGSGPSAGARGRTGARARTGATAAGAETGKEQRRTFQEDCSPPASSRAGRALGRSARSGRRNRQREAEAERQREQKAAQQREAELRRAQEAARQEQESARQREAEATRQREAAAAEQERAAAAKKAKKLKVHPDVQRFWDQYGKQAVGEVWGGPSEDAAWVRERKALAGQWNEEKEKAAVEEGRQSKAKEGKVIPLHERWEKPKKKKEGLVKRFISARREAAAERQAKQEKEAWETSRPEREAAERARRAWHIESNPAFETFSVRERRVMVNLWDKRFPMPERIEKPAERERRIEEVSTKMNRDAFHSRELALDRPKREAMLERLVARQPEQQPTRTRDPGPTRDYGPSR